MSRAKRNKSGLLSAAFSLNGEGPGLKGLIVLKKWGWGALFFLGLAAHCAFANPVLSRIAAGAAQVQQQNPNQTTVVQTSPQAIINWQSFNIQPGQTTHFQQPQGGIALNRVDPSQGVSKIYGSLTASGQIILINPAGVYFGPNAYVNVAGIMVSTAGMSNANFLAGHYQFDQASSYYGAIVNDGSIKAKDYGYIALMAPGVVNNGTLQANVGQVALESGQTFTVNFGGGSMIDFAVAKPTDRPALDQEGNPLPNGVKNSGLIQADGGQVVMTVKSAGDVLSNAIDMSGVVEARYAEKDSSGTVSLSPGYGAKGSAPLPNASPTVVLTADNGTVSISGKINASNQQGTGGTVKVAAKNVKMVATTVIDVGGLDGGEMELSAGSESGDAVQVAGQLKASGSAQGQGGTVKVAANVVNVQTTASISSDGGIGGGSVQLDSGAETLMAAGASITADALFKGNGGSIALLSDQTTEVHGRLSAKGGLYGGNCGYI